MCRVVRCKTPAGRKKKLLRLKLGVCHPRAEVPEKRSLLGLEAAGMEPIVVTGPSFLMVLRYANSPFANRQGLDPINIIGIWLA
jgi:hypothetical protein